MAPSEFRRDLAGMRGGRLSHGLWDNCALIGPGDIKGAHPVQVRAQETRQHGEFAVHVSGKPVNDLCAPVISLLLGQDGAATAPVESDELGVGRQCGLDLRRANAGLDAGLDIA